MRMPIFSFFSLLGQTRPVSGGAVCHRASRCVLPRPVSGGAVCNRAYQCVSAAVPVGALFKRACRCVLRLCSGEHKLQMVCASVAGVRRRGCKPRLPDGYRRARACPSPCHVRGGQAPALRKKHHVGAVKNRAYQGVLLAFASVLTIIAYTLSQDKGEHNTGQMI